MKPELTKERLYAKYPKFYGKDLIDRHILRYQWAASYLKVTDIVLDAACGTGYGTDILSRYCGYVVGLDNNEEAISYAWKYYPKDNISYDATDLKSYTQGLANHYNVIVSIETIEHFEREDTINILKMFYKTLKKKGKLILTTPDASLSNHTNIYHTKEYGIIELSNLMSKRFNILELYAKDKSLYFVGEKK